MTYPYSDIFLFNPQKIRKLICNFNHSYNNRRKSSDHNTGLLFIIRTAPVKIKKMKTLVFTLLFLLAALETVLSQEVADSVKVYRIETKDGNTYTGTIVSEKDGMLVLKTEKLGDLHIPLADITMKKELKEVKLVGDTYWLPNPQSSRYFWAPNGYGLAKGEAYFQNIWVLYNQVSYGISNNFSIGAGMVPLFLFSGTATPFWIVPKFSFPLQKDKFNLGAGAFLGTVLGEDTGVFGLLYGTATIGSRDKNFSFGMAYGFIQDEWADIPVFNLSTMQRIGPKGYFISENYIISAEGETGAMLSAGGRSIIRRIGLDYSLWIPIFPEMDSFVALPFLGVTIPLNGSSK